MKLTGFEGQVAFVTGAGGGIGAAVAEALGGAGAHVIVTDRDVALAQATAARIGQGGSRARALGVDVADEASVENAMAQAEAEVGPIAMLVNVAGIFHSFPMLDTSQDEWALHWRVNTMGVVHCCQSAARRMAARGAGRIVTVASQTATILRAGQAAYGASKAAAEYVTKCLGLELAPLGIRCNVVHPGVTETPLSKAIWEKNPGAKDRHVAGELARYRVPIPLRKVGQPEDVAMAVMFFLSDQAGHITLADLHVDGGATLIA